MPKKTTSTKNGPKAKGAPVDAVAREYDALDAHERGERLSRLGESVCPMPLTACKKPFAELPAAVQAALRAQG